MTNDTEYFKILTDKDFNLEPKAFHEPRIRYGARGIILNSEGKIAILNKTAKNEYKLIGGGLEAEETPEMAFEREAYEESGCKIKIEQSLGKIREEKSQDNFIQDSYVFVASILEDTGNFHFTKKEKDEGSRLLWLPLDEALAKIKNCESQLKDSSYENIYHTKFIVRRDYEILNHFLRQNLVGHKH